jgi:signal transduction histidine kinase
VTVPAASTVASTTDLLAQITWFNRMRLAAGLAVGTAAAAGELLDAVSDGRPLFALAALLLGVDAVYFFIFPRIRRRPPAAQRHHVDLQIGVDLAVLTAVLHYSGGITNPLALLYLVHAFIAALLLSIRAAFAVAVASLLLVAGLAFSELFGWLPHHPIRFGWMHSEAITPVGVLAWLCGFALVSAVAILFVSVVLRMLRARERELLELEGQLGRSEKLAALGALAAGVSHEINNPVGVIRNKVQILRYRIQDGDPKEALLHELDTVDKHAERIGSVTAGLLAFAREQPFELQAVPINGLIEEAVSLVRAPFRAAGVRLTTRLDPQSPMVSGSQNHLLQVLVNLLLNSKDASTTGGEVVISSLADAREVLVSVRDDGTGIEPEHLAKIFEPFFTTKAPGKGTGLGLAISHGIVERHQGSIRVRSKVGQGTEFTVVLPRRQ